MNRASLLPILLLLSGTQLSLWGGPAAAQNTVIQTENVRYDYAQVLRVTPVYQVLTATRMEQRCESPTPPDRKKGNSRLSRAVGALKDAISRDDDEEVVIENCRPVPVEREFRRPIAYDVDYVYKGAKFRSRLPEDPGNRLRIRIAITPVVSSASSP